MGAEDFVKLSIRARADFAMNDVSAAAELAFYRGLQYCGLYNTHGVVARSDLSQLGPRRVAAELVAKGYWHTLPQGWGYTSWEKWQHDFDQVAEKRRRDAERKREERRAARDAQMNGVDEA